MELTAAQRKIVFALVVFALAGLGVYLLTSVRHGSGTASAPPARQRQVGAPVASPAAAGSSAVPGATAVPGPVTSPSQLRVPDIYQWLPFSKSGLASAARIVVRFGDAYGTYSYTQNAAAYVGRMRGLLSTQLAAQLSDAYATPGVAAIRTRRRQVATARASIASLRAFGSTSLTFIVALTQRITATSGSSLSTVNYAVTVTGGGPSWQVSDIELASAGNT